MKAVLSLGPQEGCFRACRLKGALYHGAPALGWACWNASNAGAPEGQMDGQSIPVWPGTWVAAPAQVRRDPASSPWVRVCSETQVSPSTSTLPCLLPMHQALASSRAQTAQLIPGTSQCGQQQLQTAQQVDAISNASAQENQDNLSPSYLFQRSGVKLGW